MGRVRGGGTRGLLSGAMSRNRYHAATFFTGAEVIVMRSIRHRWTICTQ